MAEPKTKRGQDATRTERQGKYLERLQDGQGKRLVVDLDSTARASLEALLSSGYGAKQREVVERALNEAAEREKTQK